MANAQPRQHYQLAAGEKVSGMKRGGKVVKVEHCLPGKRKGGSVKKPRKC